MDLDLDAIRKDIDCWANYDRQYGPSRTDADRLAVHARTLLAKVERLRGDLEMALHTVKALASEGGRMATLKYADDKLAELEARG